MRTSISSALVVLAAAMLASAANGNGSAYSPGLTYGWDGVHQQGSNVRFVTLGTERSTIVAAIRVNGGRVVRSWALRGFYGVPLVAYDGTPGGLSGNGRSLVLSSYGPLPGKTGRTRFAVLNTRTLRPQRLIDLPGSWSYDTISPDGGQLYLVEHLSAGANPHYRVRLYDLATNHLLAGAIVDRTENEAIMRGQPVTRATSKDGRWAYTLYARQQDGPFVHALDSTHRQAFCIDLPIRLGQNKQMGLRLRLSRDEGSVGVRLAHNELARIDVHSLGD